MGPRARARGNAGTAYVYVDGAGLQWGHERALVEMLGRWSRGALLRSFNGATSARSWKWESWVGGDGLTWASMGPRARARGNLAQSRHGVREEIASMGPRARARGNEVLAFIVSTAFCFNGATSARSWKCGEGARQADGDGAASMGPRARARGN